MRRAVIAVLTVTAILASAQVAQAKAKYAVTVSVSKTQVDLGQRFTISGKVTPAARGQKVTIQRRYGTGRWRTIATDTLSSSGAYSQRIKPTKAAPTSYRVVKAGSSSRSTGTSPTRKVGTFRWRHVVDLRSDLRSAVGTAEATAMIQGTRYPKSVLVGATGAFIRYRTNGLCDDLEAKVGLHEETNAGSSDTASAVVYALPTHMPADVILAETVSLSSPVIYFRPSAAMKALPQAVAFLAYSESNEIVTAFGTPRVHCMS